MHRVLGEQRQTAAIRLLSGILAAASLLVFSGCGSMLVNVQSPMNTPEAAHPSSFTPSTPAPYIMIPANLLDTPVNTPIPIQAFDVSPVLTVGAEDAMVALLQERLMELGYFDHDKVTEYFGPATEEAVRLFQRVQGLEQTGEADGFLQSLILYDESIPYHMKEGDEGEDIKAMQDRLKELGYFKQTASGYFGSDTLECVRVFQKRNKLEETGRLDTEAIDLLYSFDARPRVDPTPTPKATPKPSLKGAEGLLEAANAHKGKPYKWGANGPDAFDCSGFLYYCLCQIGMEYIGRVKAKHYSAFGDWEEITRIKDLKAGDFLFFCTDDDQEVSHAGIYTGNGYFIHASFSSGRVKNEKLEDYFERNFVNARRIFS